MDGTLIDSETIWIEAIQAALAAKGIALSTEEITRIEYGRAWKDIFHDIHTCWPEVYTTIQEMEAFTVPYYEKVTATRDISIQGSVSLLKPLELYQAPHGSALPPSSTSWAFARWWQDTLEVTTIRMGNQHQTATSRAHGC